MDAPEYSKPPVEQSSSLNAGDILITSKPYAYVLARDLKGKYCDDCLIPRNGLRKCSGCGFAYYCHRDCQKNSWDIHKDECVFLRKKPSPNPTDTTRLIARIILKQKAQKQAEVELIHGGKERQFQDLISHEDAIREVPERLEKLNILRQQLILYIDEKNLPEDLVSIYGKVCVNSYTITDKDMNRVGIGLYLAGSIIDHSCEPNAYAGFMKNQLIVTSLVDWQSLDWSKVRISYIDTLSPTQSRKQELNEGYHFVCDCVKCQDQQQNDVMSSILCGNAKCLKDVVVTEDALGPCTHCGYQAKDATTLSNYRSVIEFTRQTLQKNDVTDYLSKCQDVLKKQESLLTSRNVWKVKALDCAFEAAIKMANFKLAETYGKQNLQGLTFCLGPSHPVVGMNYLKLAKIEKLLFQIVDSYIHYEQADSILKKVLGTFNLFYQTEVLSELNQSQLEISMLESRGYKLRKT